MWRVGTVLLLRCMLMTSSADDALVTTLSWVVGCTFLQAAAGKTRNVKDFAVYLVGRSDAVGRTGALSVLAAEAVIGFGTVLQVAVAGAGACLFIVISTIFLSWRLSASHEWGCNCFGSAAGTDEGSYDLLRPAWYALRNGAILGMSLVLAADVDGYMASLVSLGLVSVSLALGLIGGVVAERKRLSLPTHPLRQEFAPRLAPLLSLEWYEQ